MVAKEPHHKGVGSPFHAHTLRAEQKAELLMLIDAGRHSFGSHFGAQTRRRRIT